jgi:single-stranded-DNA-specific exonuclease
VSAVGGGKHLKLRLRDATGSMDAIAFGHGDRIGRLRPGMTADFAFVPSRNEWRGEERIQLRVRDLRER